MMDKKTLMAFLLIALILMLTPYYYQITNPPKPWEEQEAPKEVKNRYSETETTAYPTEIIIKQTPDDIQLGVPIETVKEEVIIISTPLYIASISNRAGGSIKSFKLKEYNLNSGGFVNLVHEGINDRNLVVSFKTQEGETVFLNQNFLVSPYIIYDDTITVEFDDTKIDFKTEYAGQTITKTLTFHPESYVIDVDIDLTNISRNNISQERLQINWFGGLPLTEKNKKDDVTYFAAHLYQGGELSKHSGKPEKPLSGSGQTAWTALRSKYFTSALISNGEGNFGSITMDPKNTSNNRKVVEPKYNMSIGFPSNKPITLSLYLGPLKYNYIKALGVDLDKIMNFGWAFIKPISHGILFLLTFMHKYIPNYGILLIIFSVVVKIVVYPLTKKSYQSTKAMQAIQPLIADMREKFKGDPQRLNKETMKLYKEHGVNPLGGCLPMLLQMPLLFALFIIFRTTIELRGAPFVWWITDLSAPDTIYQFPPGFEIPIYGDQISLLPIFMGVSMFVQQKMMGTQSTGQQKYMMYFMTGFFLLLFNNFPSGLNLYYTLFNVLTILQQKYLVPSKQAEPSLKPLKTR